MTALRLFNLNELRSNDLIVLFFNFGTELVAGFHKAVKRLHEWRMHLFGFREAIILVIFLTVVKMSLRNQRLQCR